MGEPFSTTKDTKYVFFHAFKGGTGRTYALVNIANLYARDGLNVIAIDLDVEAPGLAQRYQLDPSHPGFVEYARQVLNLEAEARLPVYDIEIDGPGSLRVIPSGNPYSEEYWNALVSDRWGEMLENGETGRNFWRMMKTRVNELEPRPDIVLIDGRAGLAELSVSVIRDLRPYVMSFINRAQPETPAGTRVLLKSLVNRTDKEHAVVGLVRRPKIVDTQAFLHSDLAARVGTEDDQSWLRDNFGDLAEETLVLTWDLEIELGGELTVPPIGEIRSWSEYWPDIHKIASHLAPRPLSIQVGQRAGETSQPVKWFLLEKGRMLNMSDRAPNLSFRVDTFRSLLDGLWSSVGDSDREDEYRKRDFGEALTESGHSTGRAFGSTYKNESAVKKLPLLDKILRWCDFDSAVGFGLLRAEMGSAANSGSIVVEQNAFAVGRSSKDHDLCLFLVGYFSGVLGELCHHRIKVEHSKCVRMGESCCRFDFYAER